MDQVANREGRNTRLYNFDTGTFAMNIPFVRITTTEISADTVWAKAGVNDANAIGFDEAAKGTLDLEMDCLPLEMIALSCNKNGVTTGGEWAVREELTAATGSITLTDTPIAGSIYVYEADSDGVGESVASEATGKVVTITGAVAEAKYIAYYLKNDEDITSVTFNNKIGTGYYIAYSDTVYKDDKNKVTYEQMKAFKIKPKKAVSLKNQGSGDVSSYKVTFDVLADDDGNTVKFSRKKETA